MVITILGKEEGQKTKIGFNGAEGKGHLAPWSLKYIFLYLKHWGIKELSVTWPILSLRKLCCASRQVLQF